MQSQEMRPSIRICGRDIGLGWPVYIVAELSANHHQDYNEAIRLLRRALRTDTAKVRALLDEIESRRPVARRGSPSAAELIRRDRDAR